MEKKQTSLSMKLRAVLFGVGLLATSLVSYAGVPEDSLNPPAVTVCHCTLLGNCKASGSGNVCASGTEAAPNVQCSDYNGNC